MDPAVQSARALAETVGWEVAHQRTVARLALALFDAARDLHVLGDEARLLLEVAGEVHDIGFSVGQAKHHKTSAAMIMDAGIEGLDHRQTAMAAAIARYHRKALPAPAHEPYSSLSAADRRTVRWCAAFLRVADGLDRAHDDAVRDVAVNATDTRLVITVDCPGSCETDLWGARRKVDLLAAESGRSVDILLGTKRRDRTRRGAR